MCGFEGGVMGLGNRRPSCFCRFAGEPMLDCCDKKESVSIGDGG